MAEFLARNYRYQQGPPWVADIDGDACLYINLYREASSEREPEEWVQIETVLGTDALVSVIADASGRYEGDQQVRDFARLLLTHFDGVAQDDRTPHLWSLNEIDAGHRVQGHSFFDYAPVR
ncbi:MAG: hypothetical protein NVS3B20_25010 [Polyangiales bacterium]